MPSLKPRNTKSLMFGITLATFANTPQIPKQTTANALILAGGIHYTTGIRAISAPVHQQHTCVNANNAEFCCALDVKSVRQKFRNAASCQTFQGGDFPSYSTDITNPEPSMHISS